jgi:V8-like Glu-specific endopeptidase
MTLEERRARIAETAYSQAKRRGFESGHEKRKVVLCLIVGITLTLGASHGMAIVNGDAPGEWSEASDRHGSDVPPAFEAVVSLHNTYWSDWERSECSGVVVRSNMDGIIILTAGHCVQSPTARGRRKCIAEEDPSNLRVYFGDGPTHDADPNEDFFTPVAVEIHPERKCSSDNHDIALVKLQWNPHLTTVPEVPELPVALQLTEEDVDSVWINHAGFGDTDNPDDPWESTKYHTDLKFQQLDSHTIEYDQHESGTCDGDSGGPGFIYDEGWYVASVNVAGSRKCIGWRSWGKDVRVDIYEHASWIANWIASH